MNARFRFRSLPVMVLLAALVASGLIWAQDPQPADPITHPLSGKILDLENEAETKELKLLFQNFTPAECLGGRFWSGDLTTIEVETSATNTKTTTSQSFSIVASRPGSEDAQRCSYVFFGETTDSSNPPKRFIRGVLEPDGAGGHTIKVDYTDLVICEEGTGPTTPDPGKTTDPSGTPDPGGSGNQGTADAEPLEEDDPCYEYEGPVTLP